MQATLPQSVRILSLFHEKGLNTEQTQQVLGSGIFTDLLEATRLGLLKPENRNEISKLLGLPHWDVWKSITVGGKTKQQLVQEITDAGLPIEDSVSFLLIQDYFPAQFQSKEIRLVRVKASNLCDPGKNNRCGNLSNIYARARERGLEECPCETGLEIYLTNSRSYRYPHLPLLVAMSSISEHLFQIERSNSGECKLNAVKIGRLEYIDPKTEFIFALASLATHF